MKSDILFSILFIGIGTVSGLLRWPKVKIAAQVMSILLFIAMAILIYKLKDFPEIRVVIRKGGGIQRVLFGSVFWTIVHIVLTEIGFYINYKK